MFSVAPQTQQATKYRLEIPWGGEQRAAGFVFYREQLCVTLDREDCPQRPRSREDRGAVGWWHPCSRRAGIPSQRPVQTFSSCPRPDSLYHIQNIMWLKEEHCEFHFKHTCHLGTISNPNIRNMHRAEIHARCGHWRVCTQTVNHPWLRSLLIDYLSARARIMSIIHHGEHCERTWADTHYRTLLSMGRDR